MPQSLALFLYIILILWLLLEERKQCPKLSRAIWLPFLWLAIIGSRPISMWWGFNVEFKKADDYLEGSPFDRIVFLLLIVLALIVLCRRNLQWRTILSENRFLFLYFSYILISTLWSPFPFTAIKRWIKDFGNVLMVLVVLTDRKPLEALQSLFIRCASILIPLSILMIKYYPNLGRIYNRWTNQPVLVGVTTDKNMLGMTIFIFGVFLLWSLRTIIHKNEIVSIWKGAAPRVILILMTLWLLSKARSSTALVTTIMATGVIGSTAFDFFRKRYPKMGTYILVCAFLGTLLFVAGAGNMIMGILGRDVTLTGRTNIWSEVLEEKINPFIGAGFYSFWLGDRNDRLSESFYYSLGEAHNGFIEIYLNVGLIGLLLFVALLFASYKKIAESLKNGDEFGVFRLVFFVAVLLYAITEAIFDRINPLWFGFLALVVQPYSWSMASIATEGGGSRFRLSNSSHLNSGE